MTAETSSTVAHGVPLQPRDRIAMVQAAGGYRCCADERLRPPEHRPAQQHPGCDSERGGCQSR